MLRFSCRNRSNLSKGRFFFFANVTQKSIFLRTGQKVDFFGEREQKVDFFLQQQGVGRRWRRDVNVDVDVDVDVDAAAAIEAAAGRKCPAAAAIVAVAAIAAAMHEAVAP